MSKTLTRADLGEAVHRKVGLSRTESADLVNTVIDMISDALVAGQQVKLSSFGTFDVREKRERIGRNPKTGEEIPISARRVVTFRPGQKLKARVEAYAGAKSHYCRVAGDSRQTLFHHRRSQRPLRRETACAALLGVGISPAQAGEAARQPPLLSAS